MEFGKNLDENLYNLQRALIMKDYKHGRYESFYVRDPKLRHIHKAQVEDRVIHQVLVNILEPIFEPKFIFDSYASRKNKGTHRAVKRFQVFARKASKNYTRNCFILKCDIKKYFDSIEHSILLRIIKRSIKNKDVIWLIEKIICSFEISLRCGLPLGNSISQLFANIYLNELDQFIKRKLGVKFYVRYNDDFIILSEDKDLLKGYILIIQNFLKTRLNLELHPKKVSIRKYSQGIDFLGYICLPHHILPRTKTKRRIIKRIKIRIYEFKEGRISSEILNQSIQSYLGFLKHADSFRFLKTLRNWIWFLIND